MLPDGAQLGLAASVGATAPARVADATGGGRARFCGADGNFALGAAAGDARGGAGVEAAAGAEAGELGEAFKRPEEIVLVFNELFFAGKKVLGLPYAGMGSASVGWTKKAEAARIVTVVARAFLMSAILQYRQYGVGMRYVKMVLRS